MNSKKTIAFFIFSIMFFAPLVLSATSATTTMTWVVPSNKSHSIAYGGSCSSSAFYFNETNCVDDGGSNDIDGNGTRCLPYDASGGGSACQSNAVAGMTITNNGNTTANIDANFLTLFSGNDVNIALKVWMGTGSGCGTSGVGGWAKDCTVTGSNPVTAGTCRAFSAYAPNSGTTGGRLVTSLGISDTNQLCFSGDFNGFQNSATFGVPAGSRAYDFNTTST